MSESEAIEALSDISANCATYFSVYISLTFAYLTVAYLVGSALSRFQLTLITAIYLLSSTLMGATTIIWVDAWLKINQREQTIFSDHAMVTALPWIPGLVILLMSVVIASVYFMYDIRRKGAVSQ